MKRSTFCIIVCAASVGVLLSSCSLFPDRQPDQVDGSAFQTDQRHYFADVTDDEYRQVEFDIPMSFTNVTEDTVFPIGCRRPPMPVLEKRVDGEWVTAYAPVELMCLSPPWAVKPGEVFRDTMQVIGARPGQNVAPIFETEIDGTYRLVRALYADREGEQLLPDSLRTSNIFDVEARFQEDEP